MTTIIGNILDPRLDRLMEFDKRSLNFPVTAVLPNAAGKPRSYSWECGVCLDQGQEGSCVGHGWGHELAAKPSVIVGITHEDAVTIYSEAQKLDEWPGESYSGTSVLAGAKAVQKLFPGAMKAYHWAFGIDEVIATIGYHGPIVLGVPWYTGMFSPNSDGVIKVGGSVAGGHCILANGVNIKKKQIKLHNSWGKSYGINGEVFISFDDLGRLLSEGGEACCPEGRHVVKIK